MASSERSKLRSTCGMSSRSAAHRSVNTPSLALGYLSRMMMKVGGGWASVLE